MDNETLIWTKLTEISLENISLIGDKISGAYRLSYKDDSDGNFYVFYVGDTVDVKETLLNHLNEDKNACIALNIKNKKCAYRYAQINNEQIRKSATKQAYNHYQPSCNEIEPEGDVNIQINLS